MHIVRCSQFSRLFWWLVKFSHISGDDFSVFQVTEAPTITTTTTTTTSTTTTTTTTTTATLTGAGAVVQESEGDESEDEESEILEESPCGRWLKRREVVSYRDVPGLYFSPQSQYLRKFSNLRDWLCLPCHGHWGGGWGGLEWGHFLRGQEVQGPGGQAA